MIARFYKTLQILSIDVAIGAISLLHFFSVEKIEWSVYILLGLAIWIIYTVDHLKDARKASDSNRKRYQYHHKNAVWLKTLVAVGLIIAFTLCLFVPVQIVLGGVIIGFLSGIYILFQARIAHIKLKECYIAGVYTSGVLLVPFMQTNLVDFYLFILLFLLAFLNLTLFSWMEIDEDKKDGFSSIATRLGQQNAYKFLVSVLFFDLILVFPGIIKGIPYIGFFTIALFLYAFLILFPNWSSINGRYRTVGDGIFLLPLVSAWL